MVDTCLNLIRLLCNYDFLHCIEFKRKTQLCKTERKDQCANEKAKHTHTSTHNH